MADSSAMHAFQIEGINYANGNHLKISVAGGLIVSVSEEENTGRIDLPFIAPGLIDNQINGYVNIDFSGDYLASGDLEKAASSIWASGVTTFLPTLITNSHYHLIRNFRIMGEDLAINKLLSLSVPGFHLEGPYISAEDGYRGCHPAEHIRKPSWDEFSEFNRASGGRIIQITLAPETEGATDFISQCRENGILVAIGHSGASAAQIKQSVDSGASLSTHLGNGCANMINRHNNPIWPQLADDRLMVSIIADGHHLTPEELIVFRKAKGAGNMILTSDVMYLAGMTPGRYKFLGLDVTLTPEGMLLNTELNCLAGASFPLKTGVGNFMRHTGCSMKEAIDMASLNVAKIYNLNDRGSLAPGKKADIILFNLIDSIPDILKTYLSGNLVYSKL
jgi:N-acetylglucosamine-6-phosphate deacetylase